MQSTAALIERRLRERFAPVYFELVDDSAKHVGHAGATSGGGHYRVRIASQVFVGASLLERHRAVNDAVRDLFGTRIHALSIAALTPEEWRARD